MSSLARAAIISYACSPGTGSEGAAAFGVVEAATEFIGVTLFHGSDHAEILRAHLAEHPNPALHTVEVPDASLPFPAWGQVRWSLLYMRWLKRVAAAIREHGDFDLVFHVSYPSFWIPSPAPYFGVPSIVCLGGGVVSPPALRRYLGAAGRASEALERVVGWVGAARPSVRRSWKNATMRFPESKITEMRVPYTPSRVVNRAVLADADQTTPQPRQPFILFPSGLVPKKGTRLAVEALGLTKSGVRLVFAHEGGERRWIEATGRHAGTLARMEFLGKVPRPRLFELYREAAAVMFTGLREEGGCSLSEAIQLGAPVIVLAHGGVLDLIGYATDPVRIQLVPPTKDAPRLLAEAMDNFVGNLSTATDGYLDQDAVRKIIGQGIAEALSTG